MGQGRGLRSFGGGAGAGAGAPGAAGGSSAGGWTRRAAAVMAVEMMGVRVELSSFRWFNSVYHRSADRGHGAGTRTPGLAGSKTQLRGGAGQPGAGLLGRPRRQPVEEGDPGYLGLDGLLEGEEVKEAVEGDGGGEVGGEGENVGEGGRGEIGLVEGGRPGAPVDEGAQAGGVGEPRGVVLCGEEGDLVLGELLGEGQPPEEGAGFDGGAC